MLEKWKDIPGIDGYQASTHGRIKRIANTDHTNYKIVECEKENQEKGAK